MAPARLRTGGARWVALVVAALAGTLIPGEATAAATLPAGPHLAFVAGNQRALVVLPGGDGSAMVAAKAGPGSILEQAWLQDPSWSPDGTRIAYALTRYSGVAVTTGEIRIVTVGGRDAPVVSLPVAGIPQEVRWSPDGRRIAFVLYTPNYAVGLATWTSLGSRWELYVVDVDGTNLRPVAPLHPSAAVSPSWSPDGKRLAFTSDAGGLTAVYWVPVDGVPIPSRVSPIDRWAHTPSWSPDGRRIAFLSSPATDVLSLPELWVAAPDGAGARRLAPTAYDAAAWSPDSRHLAFSDTTGVLVISADGTSRARRLTTSDRDLWPAWSASGDIGFVRSRWGKGPCGVYAVRLGEPERRLSSRCDASPPLVWSAR
jgi:Tol biopolymer transport system component